MKTHRTAFTLVELLVVMGIIALLIGILMPAASRVLVSVRVARTRDVLKNVEMGLKSFKRDFGGYPPSILALPNATYGTASQKRHADGTPADTKLYGQECLYHFLLGPSGDGWGTQAGGLKPLGGVSDRPYGPYYKGDREEFGYNGLTGEHRYDTILDAFSETPRPIFYFMRRTRTTTTGSSERWFDVRDCAMYDETRPAGSYGFGSQPQFEILVGVGATAADRDFLLISPGEDRYYGTVVRDTDTVTGRQIRRPWKTGDPQDSGEPIDDIMNF